MIQGWPELALSVESCLRSRSNSVIGLQLNGREERMKRILVVDDEAWVARLIKAALDAAQIEHVMDYCSDGGQGKVKAKQGGYDLITLDLSMPIMGGLGALDEIKRSKKGAAIPVVVITAETDPVVHRRVVEMGAAAILTKPFEAAELTSLLSMVLAEGADAGMQAADR